MTLYARIYTFTLLITIQSVLHSSVCLLLITPAAAIHRRPGGRGVGGGGSLEHTGTTHAPPCGLGAGDHWEVTANRCHPSAVVTWLLFITAAIIGTLFKVTQLRVVASGESWA